MNFSTETRRELTREATRLAEFGGMGDPIAARESRMIMEILSVERGAKWDEPQMGE